MYLTAANESELINLIGEHDPFQHAAVTDINGNFIKLIGHEMPAEPVRIARPE